MSNPPIQSLSVVIPCYRSGAWIERLVEDIAKATDPWAGRRELVLVDDASPGEETWQALKRAAMRYDWVRSVRLQFNVGQYRALMAGLARARGAWVATMDDDFQTPPEELPKLIAAAESHPELDAVIGAPTSRPDAGYRVLGSRGVGLLQEWLEGKPHSLQTSSFRLLRRELVEAMLADRSLRPQIAPLILHSTGPDRILNVPVERHARRAGRTGYTVMALLNLAMELALPHVRAPLRGLGLVGLASAGGAVALGLLRAFAPSVATGFTAPLLALVALAGLGLFALSLVGELAHRLLVEVSGGPRHHVRDDIGAPVLPESRREG